MILTAPEGLRSHTRSIENISQLRDSSLDTGNGQSTPGNTAPGELTSAEKTTGTSQLPTYTLATADVRPTPAHVTYDVASACNITHDTDTEALLAAISTLAYSNAPSTIVVTPDLSSIITTVPFARKPVKTTAPLTTPSTGNRPQPQQPVPAGVPSPKSVEPTPEPPLTMQNPLLDLSGELPGHAFDPGGDTLNDLHQQPGHLTDLKTPQRTKSIKLFIAST